MALPLRVLDSDGAAALGGAAEAPGDPRYLARPVYRRGAEAKGIRLDYEAQGEADPALGLDGEYAKDIWDARRFSFLRTAITHSIFWLDFRQVGLPLRHLAKRYIRTMLPHWTMTLCYMQLRILARYTNLYLGRRPQAVSFCDLSRQDFESFLENIRSTPLSHGGLPGEAYISDYVKGVKRFLEYLEREHPDAASRVPVFRLILPQDSKRRQWRDLAPESVKAVPDYVLAQLDERLPLLPPHLHPFVFIVRNTGWRPVDVLNLRHDVCLQRTDSGWWMCGDITKTGLKGHRVPITDEVGGVIAAQRDKVVEKYGDEKNPKRFLFPSMEPHRRGRAPKTTASLLHGFREWVLAQGICGEDGQPYNITFTSLRHAKAVELINNGMRLEEVQAYFGHKSMEMTLVYAKISRSTLRRSWEKTFAQGAVRVGVGGRPQAVAPMDIGDEDQLELEYIRHNLDSVRLPNGFCFRPQKMSECPAQAIPCHSCHNFCTTTEFLPQLKQQRADSLIHIEIGRKAGQARWAERNEQTLVTLEPIIALLEEGRVHHPAGKARREYTPEEWAEMAHGGADQEKRDDQENTPDS